MNAPRLKRSLDRFALKRPSCTTNSVKAKMPMQHGSPGRQARRDLMKNKSWKTIGNNLMKERKKKKTKKTKKTKKMKKNQKMRKMIKETFPMSGEE